MKSVCLLLLCAESVSCLAAWSHCCEPKASSPPHIPVANLLNMHWHGSLTAFEKHVSGRDIGGESSSGAGEGAAGAVVSGADGVRR